MATQFKLEVTKRNEFGKRASRRHRDNNLIPAEIYGEPDGNISILVNGFELTNQIKDTAFYSNVIELSLEKKKLEVILKELQRDPEKSKITHIDFLAVRQDKKVSVNVPIKFIGEEICVGVKTSGGILSHIITEIQVSCFPKDIPENIEVDVTNLDVGGSIHMTEIKLPSEVELVGASDKEHDTAIVSCYIAKEEKIEEEVVSEEGDEAAAEDGEGEKTDAKDDAKAESKTDSKDDTKTESKEDKKSEAKKE
ncbi:MAG: 50S ribosomal protein L25/general stress protein Ctc [Gammaproteobacteria bacterium]|nr:50S ribosomal protein L25/general stress protein Ctc [Gammaproteobacteria bacterium]|tara:strand:- start:348 stop:1103 length:756 start_codon:yes stop_codon:yes gene_type:complete